MNTKRFAALLLAAALAVCSITGCTLGEKTKIAATYSGGEVPAGIYILNQLSALNEAFSKVPDPSKDVLKQEIDGVKSTEWVNNRAADLTRAYVAVESEFARLGLTLDSGVAASATQSLRQSWDSQKLALEKAGVSFASAEAVTLNGVKSQLLFTAYYQDSGELAVPEAEYETFYQENYRRILTLVLSKQYDQTTQGPYDEAGAAAQLKVIEDYFARAKSGTPLFTLILENDESIHAALDSGVEAGHAHPPLVEAEQVSTLYRENTNFPQALRDQIFASNVLNTAETYEDDNYGIVFERRDLMADTAAYESAKLSMLPQMKEDDYNAHLLTVAEPLGFTLNAQAVKAFKLDTLLAL